VATPVQEARWVLRAQCGDRDALELLLTAVRPSLERYVRGLVGPSDAEDVLQEILLIVYRKLKLLEQPEVFRAWVFRIASRAAFRHLRKRTDGPTGHATKTRSNTWPHPIRRRAETLSSIF
jgi:RNA polymerase sigma-70 factor (ECF subfamily)